jgi:hypothetical protein
MALHDEMFVDQLSPAYNEEADRQAGATQISR